MRCVRARPSLATRWRRAHRGRSSEGCSCPYLFRWRSLREEWSCGAWWCSFPDKPPAHSENRWGRERGRSIPFSEVPALLAYVGYGEKPDPKLPSRNREGSTWLGRRRFPHCFAAIGLKRLTQGRK